MECGWGSGSAKVLLLLIWTIVGQGPIAFGCLDIFALVYLCSILSLSLWETARYRLKYCL